METINFISLFFAILLFVVTPGVGIAILLARTITAGVRSALAMGVGMLSFDCIYAGLVLMAMSGLAEYLTPHLYYIRLFGAAYLGYLGFKQMRQGALVMDSNVKKSSYLKSFMLGAMISFTNPKVIIFYVGFLPLFVPLATVTGLEVFYSMLTIIIGSLGGLVLILWGGHKLKRILTSSDAKIANRIIGGLMILFGIILII